MEMKVILLGSRLPSVAAMHKQHLSDAVNQYCFLPPTCAKSQPDACHRQAGPSSESADLASRAKLHEVDVAPTLPFSA